MSDRDDGFGDLSWIGEDEPNARPQPRRIHRLSDLYDDDEIAELLPPLDDEPVKKGFLAKLLEKLSFGGAGGDDDFVGVDISEPSKDEVARSRRRDSPLMDDENDPFARLVTPLSDAEVIALRHELQEEQILLVQWEREHRAKSRYHGVSLLLSLATLALIAARYGNDYIARALHDPKTPPALSDAVGEEAADAGMFALAVLLPFMALGLLIDFFSATLRTFGLRSWRALLLAIFSGVAVTVVATLVVLGDAVAAAGTLAVFFVIRGVIRLILGRGGDA